MRSICPFLITNPIYNDDDVLECALAALLQYGFVRLTQAPLQSGEVETAITRFGFVRETNYGRVFDVRIKPVTANLADSALGLEPHTDNPYRSPVPGLQILHALKVADTGGSSVLVDGFKAAAKLRAEKPLDFALLTQFPATFAWSDGNHFFSTTAPVISLDHHGNCCAIRFNHRAFRFANVPPSKEQQWRNAYYAFGHFIEDDSLRFDFALTPGDMMLMDNERILHGREAYCSPPHDSQIHHSQLHTAQAHASPARWLQGAYADKDAVLSTLTRLVHQSVETVVSEIVALFASDAAKLSYGEEVSLANHMLQTADCLASGDEPAALVVARRWR
jgi:gamma-butyrobetaine dioxygenase